MTRVTIVGGGLTGVLAAFQAYDLGRRDIVLHERFDQLGGVATPKQAHGLELRHACIYLGAPGDPIRTLLEAHGQAFDDFENHFGAVNLDAAGEQVFTPAFGGPVLPAAEIELTAKAGDTLADRIAAYPPLIAESLRRYCDWHLGVPLDLLHEGAVAPLGIGRVFPSQAQPAALAAAKRADPLYDELYALTRQAGGAVQNTIASEPRGGFSALFANCRKQLESLGVQICDTSLVSPRQALLECGADNLVVWAASPTPLFKAVGLATPALIKKSFATYVFKVEYNGPIPFFAHNFTGQGGVFRIYLYRSGGQALLTAECVTERSDSELRGDIAALMAGFGGESLALGELVSTNVAPRWIYHSLEAITQLKALRATLAARMGAAFVPGAWEPYAKAAKFAEMDAALRRALSEKASLRITGGPRRPGLRRSCSPPGCPISVISS